MQYAILTFCYSVFVTIVRVYLFNGLRKMPSRETKLAYSYLDGRYSQDTISSLKQLADAVTDKLKLTKPDLSWNPAGLTAEQAGAISNIFDTTPSAKMTPQLSAVKKLWSEQAYHIDGADFRGGYNKARGIGMPQLESLGLVAKGVSRAMSFANVVGLATGAMDGMDANRFAEQLAKEGRITPEALAAYQKDVLPALIGANIGSKLTMGLGKDMASGKLQEWNRTFNLDGTGEPKKGADGKPLVDQETLSHLDPTGSTPAVEQRNDTMASLRGSGRSFLGGLKVASADIATARETPEQRAAATRIQERNTKQRTSYGLG